MAENGAARGKLRLALSWEHPYVMSSKPPSPPPPAANTTPAIVVLGTESDPVRRRTPSPPAGAAHIAAPAAPHEDVAEHIEVRNRVSDIIQH